MLAVVTTGCWGVRSSACGLPPGNEAPASNRCALVKHQANKRRTLMKTSQAIANQARGWSQLKESLGTEPPGPRGALSGPPGRLVYVRTRSSRTL